MFSDLRKGLISLVKQKGPSNNNKSSKKSGNKKPATPVVSKTGAAGSSNKNMKQPNRVVKKADPFSLEENKNIVDINTLTGTLKKSIPDEKRVKDILNFDGLVLTAAGGQVEEFNEVQRKIVAYLDNGILLVARSEDGSAAVESARHILERRKLHPIEILLVDREVIHKINDNDARKRGNASGGHKNVRMERAVIKLIETAANLGCSDIHIDATAEKAKVRMRSDGIMVKMPDMDPLDAADLMRAAFVMADSSDAQYKPYEPQGARISNNGKVTLPKNVMAVRLQFNPLGNGGRYTVMRILYGQNKELGENVDVDSVGYCAASIRQIKEMRSRTHGIVVISGPTGSGKSTTLKIALEALDREKKKQNNIVTVEDPPEYPIEGAIQLAVVNAATEEERNEAFRSMITASLRSDPDVIMIGEIRDSASAKLAFQAATTGHQAWVSLHANNSVSILARLKDLNVEDYKVFDPDLVTGLIAQRLVRKLCPHCKVPIREAAKNNKISMKHFEEISQVIPDYIHNVFVQSERGCDHCGERGTVGRTVVGETIIPDNEFMDLMRDGKKKKAIDYWYESLEGKTMLEHAFEKVVNGEIDPFEVYSKVGPIKFVSKARLDLVFERDPPSVREIDKSQPLSVPDFDMHKEKIEV